MVMVQQVTPDDAALRAINRVVEDAVRGWDLAERVKRLVIPTYRYTPCDAQHLTFAVARDRDAEIVGVAAWEATDDLASVPFTNPLSLHGLFVQPAQQGRGIGRLLVGRLTATAARGGHDAILVKAQRGALGFFTRQGFQPMPAGDAASAYAHRMGKAIPQARSVLQANGAVAAGVAHQPTPFASAGD